MRAVVAEIEASDGTVVEPPEHGVLVVVGPNNAGKSALLRELWQHLTFGWPTDGSATPVVLPRVRVIKEADSDEELQQWFEQHCYVQVNERTQHRSYRRANQSSTLWEVLHREFRDGRDQGLGPALAGFLALYAGADGRLGLLGGGTNLWDPMSDVPSNPLQVLYADRALERRLSDICFEAFRLTLTLSRIPGSSINLHVGATEHEATIDPNPEYMQAIREMPLLSSQGDGMRSFMGLMLALVSAAFPLILVDEPEAFLHPPQARLLGRKLAEEAAGRSQVLAATHDSDFLAGALDVMDAEISVVRLTRHENVNRVSALAADQLREMWNDPILRYSNILDGLFHRGVVVCESDSDSRYYGAVLDASRMRDGLPPHDLLLTQCGGMQRFGVVVRALRAVDVPAAVIADFDILRDEVVLRRAVEAFGEDWERFRDDWRVVDAQVRARERNVTVDYAREEIANVLDGDDRTLTRAESDRIRTVTKVEDGWSVVKETGIAGLPAGDATARCEALLATLREIGIFVVPVGQLESWHGGIGGHGPPWVVEVLVQGLHDQADTPSRGFIGDVTEFLEAKAAE